MKTQHRPPHRQLARTRLFLVFLALLRAATSTAGYAHADAPPLVQSVGEITVTVSDGDRSLAFYRDVLGAVLVNEEERASAADEALYGVFGARIRTIHLRLGHERLALMQFLTPRGRPISPEQRSQDGGFQHVAIVVSDMDAGYRWLREHRVEHVSSGPQTLPAWNKGAAGIRAFYFADPDRHTLEIIWFPAGKGDPRWQVRAASAGSPAGDPHTLPHTLFVGIDHTAIGVRDTDASLRLYRDRLGLRVAGTSENYGTEQEHLNNVFAAHLRITTLRAASGPGIELLEYLSPRDGRPAPADLRVSDLLHWHTSLQVENAPATLKSALQGSAQRVSAAVVEAATGTSGVPVTPATPHSLLVRDADAHGLLFVEGDGQPSALR